MIDLHVHSTYSDGTLTPAELISLAENSGVEAIALCDHNTIAGLSEFLAAADNSPVEAVPGVEFSTEYQGAELHVLGLFIQPRDYGAVTALLTEMLARKEQSNRTLIAALNQHGIAVDYDAIKAGIPCGQVNRAVIAAEMVRKGYSDSVSEAISHWLSIQRGFYRPPRRLDAFETIHFIKSIGAIAVLAHPFLNLNEGALRAFLPRAKDAGLDAMEVYYPRFDEDTTALARRMAEEYGLLPSGGSDFHGENKPDISLGTGTGKLRIPYAVLDDLKNLLKQNGTCGIL